MEEIMDDMETKINNVSYSEEKEGVNLKQFIKDKGQVKDMSDTPTQNTHDADLEHLDLSKTLSPKRDTKKDYESLSDLNTPNK